MEHFDAEKAQRVWNRVQGRSQPAPADWSSVISIKTQTAAMYQRLSRYFRGKTGAVLLNFSRQEQTHIAALSGKNNHYGYTPLPRKEPVFSLLQQCYGYKLQLLRAYEPYTVTHYGPILQEMITQEQAQCQFLLRLMEQQRPRHRR